MDGRAEEVGEWVRVFDIGGFEAVTDLGEEDGGFGCEGYGYGRVWVNRVGGGVVAVVGMISTVILRDRDLPPSPPPKLKE